MEIKGEENPNVHPNKIKIADFLMSWAEILPPEYFLTEEEIPAANLSRNGCNIPEEMVSELETICGANSLKCDEVHDEGGEQLFCIPDDADLDTLKMHDEHLNEEVDKGMSYHHITHQLPPKERAISTLIVDEVGNISVTVNEQSDFLPDVMLTVQVCDPFHKDTLLRMDSEWIVCGRQCLTELRDLITCPNDLNIAGEFSHNLDVPKDICAKDLYKSGFFLIDNVFYNDMRDQVCRDYSEVVIKWANGRNRGCGPFESKKMENSTFLDLSINLGKPYVYVHQGDCEHLLIFTSIRMLHESDNHNLSDYPILHKSKIRRLQKCRICQAFGGKWIVKGSHLLAEDPCLLCEPCLKMLHYDAEGNKIGDFTAQVFVDHSFKNLPLKQGSSR